MAMSQATLATELDNLDPTTDEAAAIIILADAYGVFVAEAQAATPILPAGVAMGKAAMAAGLVGMSTDGAGTTLIPAAIIAFWVAVAAGLTTSFAGATLIVPPPHATLASAFAALMPANVGKSKTDALDAIASLLLTQAIVGGVVTVTEATPII